MSAVTTGPGFAATALDRYGLPVLAAVALGLVLFVALRLVALPLRFALVVVESAAARADHHLTRYLTTTTTTRGERRHA